ncbi:MAG TPA: ABC transporter ATP-binding protein [Povalibacter sp.]
MTAAILQLRDVHAHYGSREVLRGVSVQLGAGEWFCLLGPNGSGKSTLLHCISTQVLPSAGEVIIGDSSLRTDPLNAKRALGFAPSPEQLPGLLSGRQCLEVYALAKGIDRVDDNLMELSTQLGFTRFIDDCVDTYSLGTRQKLCVLLALLGSPRLMVLDEAFNGLDPGSALTLKRYLRDRLAARECAVLLATHSLDIVEHYADRAALLLGGRLVREWDAAQIRRSRREGEDRLEEMIAAASADNVVS